MEYRFEFDGSEVLALVEESRAADERLMTEAQQFLATGIDIHAEAPDWHDEVDHPATGSPPGLWLMNDRGVYLRSNARKQRPGHVAWASGYQTDVQVGDEPMCEYLAADKLKQLQEGDVLVITLSDAKMRLSLLRDG